jgi:hypothetical protein
MKLCYCDESGTGDEPIATMVGIVVDASRMHLTKTHWQDLLDTLSNRFGRKIAEIHTRDFYAGNGLFRDMDGPARARLITSIFEWLTERKHYVVYSSVVKKSYFEAYAEKAIPDELNTPWRFLGFHLVLAMQKHCQNHERPKGHTIYVFDNEEREKMRFTDLIARPPVWSDSYYRRGKKQDQLDQVIDAPFFGDSRDVVLIQLADMIAFLLRRYAEVKSGLAGPRYIEEEQRLTGWMQTFRARAISPPMYPKKGRQDAEELFYQHAPQAIRDL